MFHDFSLRALAYACVRVRARVAIFFQITSSDCAAALTINTI